MLGDDRGAEGVELLVRVRVRVRVRVGVGVGAGVRVRVTLRPICATASLTAGAKMPSCTTVRVRVKG